MASNGLRLDTPNLLEQFSESLVKRDADIITFAEDPRFVGGHLFPRQRTLLKLIFLEDLSDYDKKVIAEWQSGEHEVTLSPYTMERYEWLRKRGAPHFRLVQLVGGRRSGKGHITALAAAYKIFKTQQIDNPHLFYGIERGKPIFFSVVAAALEQAVDHQFGDIKNTLLNCKYMVDNNLIGRYIQTEVSVNTGYDLRRKNALAGSGTRVDADIASLRVKAHGTNSKTIRGAATMFFSYDEAAHQTAGESRLSDEEIWAAVLPSLNQFKDHALIFSNSSPWHKQGEFYKLYERIMQTDKLDPKTTPFEEWPFKDHLMVQFPSWATYVDWEKDPYWDVIGPEVSGMDDLQMQEARLADPEGFKVEYMAQFAEVSDAFLRPEMVERMFSSQYHRETLGYDIEPTIGAQAYKVYKGHGDPSTVGANFGIAIGHTEEVVNPESGNKETHVVFDVVDAFFPKLFDNETIDWLQVVPHITNWINSFRPYEFTFDQHNAIMPLQQITANLRKIGITETVVYEKTANRALNVKRARNFRTALNLGRVHAPNPSKYTPGARYNAIELAKNELMFLVEKPVGSGIVDKPSFGPITTKDIADAIMEVTDSLIGNQLEQEFNSVGIMPAFGAPGGYAIGQVPTGMYGNTDTFDEFGSWYPYTGRDRKIATPRLSERGYGHKRI